MCIPNYLTIHVLTIFQSSFPHLSAYTFWKPIILQTIMDQDQTAPDQGC